MRTINSNNNNLTSLPVYRKALDIFKLSRSIASYISYDKNILEMYGTDKVVDQYAGNLVMDSLALAPKIAAAETNMQYEVKMKHARSLRKLSKRLQKYCEQLELNKGEGREFIQLLRNELRMFKKLQHSWVVNFK